MGGAPGRAASPPDAAGVFLQPGANVSDSALAANVRYCHPLGYSFTPLRGKKPFLKGWQRRDRETLDEALDWAARGNVGLRTGGASGIVVIDQDPGGDVTRLGLPPTVTVTTGRDGKHYYYRTNVPLGNSAGTKLGPHIDFRGDGGQVVFPGSTHPDTGRLYDWVEGMEPWAVPIADLPQSVVDLLRAPSGRRVSATTTPVGDTTTPETETSATTTTPEAVMGSRKRRRYVEKVLASQLKAVSSATIGTRNATLNTGAFVLGRLVGGGYLNRNEVEAALATAAGVAGLDAAEVAATIRSGLEAGARQPRVLGPDRPGRGPAPVADLDSYILLPGPHTSEDGEVIEQSNAEFGAEVIAGLPEDIIYRRGGIPGEIIGSPGSKRWEALSTDRARLLVDSHVKLARYVVDRRTGGQQRLFQACNRDAAGLVVACAACATDVRELAVMVPYPIYGRNYIRIEPGWHDGLYYDAPEELRGLEPELRIEVIARVLYDLVVDFPFKSEADRQNFFGLLLTPIIAPAIDGNRPMHLVDTSLERTGKSKLVNEVWGGIVTGQDTPSLQVTEHEDEREKR
ncbi:MAG: bifunctional DNA primase/polymerase, partial [Planctomycetota bacterium]